MTSAIAELAIMSIITTSMTKPLKELRVPHLLPKNPFLKVKFLIILYIKLHFLYIKEAKPQLLYHFRNILPLF